jgi:integrase
LAYEKETHMLTLYRNLKRSPYWIIRGRFNGRDIYESTGSTDKMEAERIKMKLLRDLLGKADDVNGSVTFDEAVKQYLQSNPRGCRKELEKIVEHIGHVPITSLNQVRVNELIATMTKGRNLKGSTINRSYITPIVAVMRYAADTSLTGALLPRIKRRPEIFVPAKVPSEEHIRILLQSLPYGMAMMLALMTATGLRTGEAYRIRREDIRDGLITIWKTKNGVPKQIVVPDGWEYPEHGWDFSLPQFWRTVLRSQLALVGVVHRVHELGRHAFAARFLKAGNDIKRLQEAGHWATLAVPAKIYGHIQKQDVTREVKRLARNVPIPTRNVFPVSNVSSSHLGNNAKRDQVPDPKRKNRPQVLPCGPSLGRKRP